MPPIDHLAAFAAQLARANAEDQARLADAAFEHEPKLDVFAGSPKAYTLEQVIPGYGIDP
jgi:hypothetical protein